MLFGDVFCEVKNLIGFKSNAFDISLSLIGEKELIFDFTNL